MSHRFHPNPDIADPIEAMLWDDCERCDQQAKDPRGLDHAKLAEAWQMMLAVEIHHSGRRYLTANERRLSGTLYMMFVLIERLQGVGVGGLAEVWRMPDV